MNRPGGVKLVEDTNLDFMGEIQTDETQWNFTLRTDVKGHSAHIQGAD
jgi:hypothetical protein